MAGSENTVNTSRSEESRTFIAYGASAQAEELVGVRFESAGGRLRAAIVQREPLGFEAAPVVLHAKRRLLYVASLRAAEGEANRLAVFAVGDDGRLTRKRELVLKHGSAYLSLDRAGRYLLSVSYFDGHVDVYRIDERGIPSTLVQTQFEGRDKAHSILTSPNNRYAYVPFVKDNNALFQYAFDAATGRLAPLDPPQANVPDGAGPRHVAYHPTEPLVFFSNEQHLGATSYRIGAHGRLTLVQIRAPGDLKPAEGLAASDIAITPDGRFLYVAVRDFEQAKDDAVHGYGVHADGTLAYLGKTAADAIPWGLDFLPGGKHLLVTAAHAETLNAYEIGTEGGLEKRVSIKWGKMLRDIVVVPVHGE